MSKGNCKSCKNIGCGALGSDWTPRAGIECYGYQPLTNADRIRAMTDEEIENWYWWMHKEMMNCTESHVFVHDWLKQEVDNG